MRKIVLYFILLFGVFVSADTELKQLTLLNNYKHVYDVSDHSGQTYLSFMQKVIKPAIDELAKNGYQIADGGAIERVYHTVDKKVQRAIDKNGGLQSAKRVSEALKGKTVTLNSLPNEISKIDRRVDRYDLAMFLGLASGGGVVIRYSDSNYAYNVHYDTVERKSGRSFGAGPTRLANDASDKAYLDDLSEFSRGSGIENLPQFYQGLLEALLDTDTTNYRKITDFGQTVLTDFLAVYTAEQARNLMDGRVDIHWDAALLEVTLLASFHAGQDIFKFYYEDRQTKKVLFTDTVWNQTRCAAPQKRRKASMRDYWQFSKRVDDQKNCARSGINITKKEFRKLGERITSYMFANHSKMTLRVQEAMGVKGRPVKNLYHELSRFLISNETPKKLDTVNKIASVWVDFLTQVTDSARDITKEIERAERTVN